MEITLVDDPDLQVRIKNNVVQISLMLEGDIQRYSSFPLDNANHDPLPAIFISPNHREYTTISIIHNHDRFMFDIDLFLTNLTPETFIKHLFKHYFIALGIPKRIKIGNHSIFDAELVQDTFSQLGIQIVKPEI